jgi:chromosome segregation ATPase
MLQRAASSAYSWWWASHIRTTQSKWLDTTLSGKHPLDSPQQGMATPISALFMGLHFSFCWHAEMEARVQSMLKLIGADADSFGKKAELYFRSRPELINHVEEMFKSYQALADRYDRISSELHRANHTIATVFPDQVQFSMQEGDGEGLPKAISRIDLSDFKFPLLEGLSMGSQGTSRGTSPVPRRGGQLHRRVTSHMTKEKAQEEIDKLQKQILVLQTEKEFLKTSYDSALGKYLDIEKQVAELQDEVCILQDAFSTGAAIEDNEARALMAAQAIVSCEDTLTGLHNLQKRSSEEAKVEFHRANEAMEKLKTFKDECGLSHTQIEEVDGHDTELNSDLLTQDTDDSAPIEGQLNLQELCQRLKQLIELHPEGSVAELADKVDRLVEKVINLELAATSQIAQINRMRTEIDNLHKHLHALEEDKMTLVVDSDSLADRLKKAEEALQAVQQIGRSIQNGSKNISEQITGAFRELTEFVETLNVSDPQISDAMDSSQASGGNASLEENSRLTSASVQKESSNYLHLKASDLEKHDEGSEYPVVREQLEYASVLQSYKDTEQKLSEIEKRNQEYRLEAMSELKVLKIANATKDEEIHSLKCMLSSLQKKMSASIIESTEKSEVTGNTAKSKQTSKMNTSPATEGNENSEIDEYIKQCQIEDPLASVAEDKFRAEIDRVLGENLDFWLTFSTSYHQIRNFQKSFDKLKTEMDKMTNEQAEEGPYGFTASYQVAKLESAILEKKFRDLNTDLQVWMEKNVLLKGEVENRFSALCSIQEEISKITPLDRGDEVHFTTFQAAKFQGEVFNMKQENNKVAKELEAGLDHVRSLQVEVGRVLLKLRDNLELSMARSNRAQQNFRNLVQRLMLSSYCFHF